MAPVELNILLKDQALADILHVVEVKDNEMVLQYENGLLKQVLTAGRYTFWKSVVKYEFVRADTSKIEITENIDRAVLLSKQVIAYVRTAAVENYEKALLFVDGKYVKVMESGVYYWWKNNIAVVVNKVDMRQQQLEINGQEILTKDKAALREYVAGYSFDELLDKKESIAPFILQQVKEKAAALGMEVIGFGIHDIILPGDVREIMNQVLVAEKKAQANTIMRREETASTRSLLNTARLMEDNSMLWKLKEMEYVEKIADKISSISVSGNGVLVEQLKQIFVPPKQ